MECKPRTEDTSYQSFLKGVFMRNERRQVNKRFADAIDWNAFDKAMSDKKSRKEIESILKKARL